MDDQGRQIRTLKRVTSSPHPKPMHDPQETQTIKLWPVVSGRVWCLTSEAGQGVAANGRPLRQAAQLEVASTHQCPDSVAVLLLHNHSQHGNGQNGKKNLHHQGPYDVVVHVCTDFGCLWASLDWLWQSQAEGKWRRQAGKERKGVWQRFWSEPSVLPVWLQTAFEMKQAAH